MTAFNLEAATKLAATGGLSDVQRQAVERSGQIAIPTAAEEIWRYSRIAELDLSGYVPALDDVTITGGAALVSTDVAADELAGSRDLFDELNAAFSRPIFRAAVSS